MNDENTQKTTTKRSRITASVLSAAAGAAVGAGALYVWLGRKPQIVPVPKCIFVPAHTRGNHAVREHVRRYRCQVKV